MNTMPFQIESELEVQYTVLHPQLCGQGGNAVLREVLSRADEDTYVLSGPAHLKLKKSCSRSSCEWPASPPKDSSPWTSGAQITRNTRSTEDQGGRDRTQRGVQCGRDALI